MRLIDADLLIKCMNNRYNEKKDIVPDNLTEGFMQMEKLIKEQPTACDIDNVITELKQLSDYHFTKYCNCEPYNLVQKECRYASSLAFDEAIDIVKAGVKNE